MKKGDIFFVDAADLVLQPLSVDGHILDIGGGGEGVIGQLNGRQVVAIDCREDELMEAPDGPLKVLMDARNLRFLDESFDAATAFFSLMYFVEEVDQQVAISEVFRTLKPGGTFRIWDLDISTLPERREPLFAVRLKVIIDGVVSETAYGRPWPVQRRSHHDYRCLMEEAGFHHVKTEALTPTFYSLFEKQGSDATTQVHSTSERSLAPESIPSSQERGHHGQDR